MKKVVISFDLKNTKEGDYDLVYEFFESFGLSRYSPAKELRLPNSTVLGDLKIKWKNTA